MVGTEEPLQRSKTGNDIFNELEFKATKRFKEAPNKCECCGKKDTIIGIELIGAKEGALYWECEHCKTRYLKFTKQTTVKYLKKASELWIDLGGLENICEQLPN
tara:strand:- start:201 stop:512 length:312 start_codon:yes stop_codon:yes gene_type:complete